MVALPAKCRQAEVSEVAALESTLPCDEKSQEKLCECTTYIKNQNWEEKHDVFSIEGPEVEQTCLDVSKSVSSSLLRIRLSEIREGSAAMHSLCEALAPDRARNISPGFGSNLCL